MGQCGFSFPLYPKQKSNTEALCAVSETLVHPLPSYRQPNRDTDRHILLTVGPKTKLSPFFLKHFRQVTASNVLDLFIFLSEMKSSHLISISL